MFLSRSIKDISQKAKYNKLKYKKNVNNKIPEIWKFAVLAQSQG